jgi:hypothetical protein
MYNVRMTSPDLRYPIGRFEMPATIIAERREAAIDDIAALPGRMRAAVHGLENEQLDTPYRPGGWTIRQVVHHVPDSHMNALTRLKLALTERAPAIKPYDEAAWARLADCRMPIEPSLAILDGVHARWAALLRALGPEDFGRTWVHPEFPDGPRTIEWLVQQYAWHGRHHVAHVINLRTREGW